MHFGIRTRFPHAYPITFLLTLLSRASIHSLAATCAARSLLTQGESADSKMQSGGKGRDAKRQSKIKRGARKRSPLCVCMRAHKTLYPWAFSLHVYPLSSFRFISQITPCHPAAKRRDLHFAGSATVMSVTNEAHMQIPPPLCGMTRNGKRDRMKKKKEKHTRYT